MVRDAVPGSRVSFVEDAGPDLRNYSVDFSKLNETFRDPSLRWSARNGIDELVDAYTEHGTTCDDLSSSQFMRLRRTRKLLSALLIVEMLRRQTGGRFPGQPVPRSRKMHTNSNRPHRLSL